MDQSPLSTSDLSAYCPTCSTCLDIVAKECPECGSLPPEPDWPPLRKSPYPFLGKVIDERYLVDRFLDSGTSGHVYRARALQFPRYFAIKIVDIRRYGDEERQKMINHFRREIDTISQITNPHVIDVYEAIELNEAIYGLVMNYIDGQTLNAFLEQQGRLEIDEAVSIAIQIANGLQEAHRRKIIHRDLKPDNIMIEELPASGLFARILDFGIAHTIESSEHSYGFQGTPLYAAPEQCMATAAPIARSDIYSLGCVFYHMLTGQPPFDFHNALQVMDAHIDAPRPRLEDGADGKTFPEALENLTAHLMARDPEDRPESLHQVHQDLTAYEKGAPLRHFGAPPAYRSEPPPADDDTDTSRSSLSTPSPEAFISLGERTSSELASEPTFSEIFQEPSQVFESDDSRVDMELVAEVDAPVDDAQSTAITASVIDRRGLACVMADSTPAVHLIGLGKSPFHSTFSHDHMVSALDIDLHHGLFVIGDVSGQLSELDAGTGRILGTHELGSSPLAVELLPEARKAYFGTERGELYLLDLRTDTQHEIHRFPRAISTLFAGNKGTLLVGLWDGSVAQVSDEQLHWHHPIAQDAIADIGYLDDERYFALDGQGTLYIGEISSGLVEQSFAIGPGLRTARRLVSGRLVALAIVEDSLQTWKIETQVTK